jgi:hypothetical protein
VTPHWSKRSAHLAAGCEFAVYPGWTIEGVERGTRFTNDRTGHGMFVSLDEVTTY